jgi:hypothetical protein
MCEPSADTVVPLAVPMAAIVGTRAGALSSVTPVSTVHRCFAPFSKAKAPCT